MYNKMAVLLFIAITIGIGPHVVAKQYVSFDVKHGTYQFNPLLQDALTVLKELRSTPSESRSCTVRLKNNDDGHEIELIESHSRINHWYSVREYLVLFGAGAACFAFGLMIGNLSN